MLFGIDLAIYQRDDIPERESFCNIRDAEIRHADASIRMMACQVQYDRGSPIMSNPNSLLYPELVEKVEHVLHQMLDGVVLVVAVEVR